MKSILMEKRFANLGRQPRSIFSGSGVGRRSEMVGSKNASEEHMDKIHACFSFFEYIKDHSALAIRILEELKAFCKELS